MTILQILPSLDVGGVETGTIDLAKFLARSGHKAIVVSGGGRLVRELDIPGARHYTLPVGKKSLPSIFRMVKAVADIIRREDVDIVHARSRVPALIAAIACRLTNRVFITTAHGHYSKHSLSRVMGWGKFVIVASNAMAKHMTHVFRVPHERLRLVPRGVDLEKFTFRDPAAYQPKEFTVGMVSRITPLKGHMDFIKAVSILCRDIPNLTVLIAGSAPKEKHKEDLDLLVRQYGLGRVIEFVGPQEDVPGFMRRLDLLVSATTTPEAFGRVIIEAQACGVPVVATRVGGVVDIIEDGKTGLFSAPFSPREMAQKILSLYHDKTARRTMAAAARARVERDFNLEQMMSKTFSVYEQALKVSNILVIKMSALGDVVLSVPSLRAIRVKYTDARIKVLVDVHARAVLDRCPYIDDRIVCDLQGRDKGPGGFFRLAGELQRNSFDIVIDLQNNKKSHLLSFLTFAPLRYGYDNRRFSFLLNKRIKDDAPYLNPIEHQLRVLKVAGIKSDRMHLELWPSEEDDAAARQILGDNWVKVSQNLVGVNASASSRWVTKNWPAAYIAALCDRLAKDLNVRVVLTGTAQDRAAAEEVRAATKAKPIIAAGKTTIGELAGLMRHFKAFVTPDSAPMHIAAAMGTPFVALFGPTDPARHVPPAKDSAVIFKKDIAPCAPCYNAHCMKNFKCMRKITVDEVFAAVARFIK